MIKVYGVHGSPFVRKVFIALDFKGIPYETVPQMPFSGDKDYLKINPLGKVPSLVDGELTLCDSKVICRYLENAYPQPAKEVIISFYQKQFGDGHSLARARTPFVVSEQTRKFAADEFTADYKTSFKILNS